MVHKKNPLHQQWPGLGLKKIPGEMSLKTDKTQEWKQLMSAKKQ
jgi:hypothetical protein